MKLLKGNTFPHTIGSFTDSELDCPVWFEAVWEVQNAVKRNMGATGSVGEFLANFNFVL